MDETQAKAYETVNQQREQLFDQKVKDSGKELASALLAPTAVAAGVGLLFGSLIGHPLLGMFCVPLIFLFCIAAYGFGYAQALEEKDTVSDVPSQAELDRKAIDSEWNV